MSKKAMLLPPVGLVALGLVAIFAFSAGGEEVDVPLEQLPGAVRATILSEAAGGIITEIERETRDGVTVYEAEFLVDGQEVEIRVASDGTLLGREVEAEEEDDDDLTLDQVPAPVREAFRKVAGAATIDEVSREQEDGVVVYEANWKKDGKPQEAAVTADGTLLEIEGRVALNDAPTAVRAAVAQHFGADGQVILVKKMIVVYEAEGKVDGQKSEIFIFPTGRVHEGHNGDDDDDEDDDD